MSEEKAPPGVASMEQLRANLDAAHECKWKALAGELVAQAELVCSSVSFDTIKDEIRGLSKVLAKAREAGL